MMILTRIRLVVVMGTCFSFLFGVGFTIYTVIFLQSALPGSGTVVQLIEKPHSKNGEIYYHPKIEFRDSGGQKVTFVSSMGSISKDFTLGQQVPILYSSKDSSRAKVRQFIYLWGGATAGFTLFVLGLVSLLPIQYFLRKFESEEADT